MARYRDECLVEALAVVRRVWVVRDVAEVSVRDLRDARTDKVVKIKRYRAIRDGLVPNMGRR